MFDKPVVNKVIRGIIKHELKSSANNTTCGVLYQPKAPTALKKFSKVENDK